MCHLYTTLLPTILEFEYICGREERWERVSILLMPYCSDCGIGAEGVRVRDRDG